MTPCPICRHSVAERAQNPAFPFCSPRCKQVDLGAWLDEKYRFPAPPTGEEGDEVPETYSEDPEEKA